MSQDPVVQSFQDGVASYAGTTDTRLVQTEPSTNFATIRTITVDATPPSTALLRWDLSAIPPGSAVVAATMTLKINVTSIHEFEIYEVKRPWVEGEATWNQASAGVSWAQPGVLDATDRGFTVLGLASGPVAGQRTLELNAAGQAVVQSWVDNPSLNHGFVIQNYSTSSDALGFRSRESALSDRPIFTITYVPPEQTGSAVPADGKKSEKPAKPEASKGSRLLVAQITSNDADSNNGPDGIVPLGGARGLPKDRGTFDKQAPETIAMEKGPLVMPNSSATTSNWAALRLGRAALVDEVLANEETLFGKRSLLFSE
jgi:hypothetical protein